MNFIKSKPVMLTLGVVGTYIASLVLFYFLGENAFPNLFIGSIIFCGVFTGLIIKDGILGRIVYAILAMLILLTLYGVSFKILANIIGQILLD